MRDNVQLVPASADDTTVVRNLMHLYLHDFSELNGSDPNAQGLFAYPYLDDYWTDEGRAAGRRAFLIMVGGTIAGFALRNRWSVLDRNKEVSTVAEFFVLRKWRRGGVGRAAARALFDLFPGAWEVRQTRANIPAQAFWRSVISTYTAGRWDEVDMRSEVWDGPVQVFSTPR